MWYDWPSALCVAVSGFHSAVYATSVLRMYQQVSLNVILLFIQQQIILLRSCTRSNCSVAFYLVSFYLIFHLTFCWDICRQFILVVGVSSLV